MLELSASEYAALSLSLRVALWTVAVSLPLAIAVAWLLARSRFPGKSLINTIVHLPLVLPPVVTGYLLLIVFGRKGLIGEFLEQTFGIVFAFRWTGAVLAASIMAFPLLVRPIRLSIEAIDSRLESAAATLGAGRIAVFLSITLPLALPGILAGAILGFAKAMGEFGATITFVSNIPGETQTLPIAIYSVLQVPGGEAAALRLTLIAVTVSVLALIASELFARWLKRRIEG